MSNASEANKPNTAGAEEWCRPTRELERSHLARLVERSQRITESLDVEMVIGSNIELVDPGRARVRRDTEIRRRGLIRAITRPGVGSGVCVALEDDSCESGAVDAEIQDLSRPIVVEPPVIVDPDTAPSRPALAAPARPRVARTTSTPPLPAYPVYRDPLARLRVALVVGLGLALAGTIGAVMTSVL
jgi:hypothetical protein